MCRICSGTVAGVLAAFVLLSCSGARSTTNGRRAARADALRNPIAPTAESLERGRGLYDQHCAECHGGAGKGDGMSGMGMQPPPADLTDDRWKHGISDADVFTIIRDGTGEGMKPFGRKMSPRDIWHVVNYVRSLPSRANPTH